VWEKHDRNSITHARVSFVFVVARRRHHPLKERLLEQDIPRPTLEDLIAAIIKDSEKKARDAETAARRQELAARREQERNQRDHGRRGRGRARRRSGTRETDLLAPENTVQAIDALVLSGGSAFGLDAAAGKQARLRGQDRGFPIGPARVPCRSFLRRP
jgi:hypothetical protein